MLKVANVFKTIYANYDVYVVVDAFDVRIFRFVNKTSTFNLAHELDEFELVLKNDFELMINKKLNAKVNLKLLTKHFRKTMLEICGKGYKNALYNYLNYQNAQYYC